MEIEVAKYGRYDIRSGRLAGQWAAIGYRRKLQIAKATAGSRDEAVNIVKAELDAIDAREASECDAEGAPPAKAYERALADILPTLKPGYLAMLRAHFFAPDHLISATNLANAAGYANYGAANLHYGTLGQRIADEIGFVPPSREDGTPIWTSVIARDPATDPEFKDTASMMAALSRSMEKPHFEWQMRPQVVEALRALGW